jgi:hypothetical protein
MAVVLLHGLGEMMHAAFGPADLLCKAAYALSSVHTKTVENQSTFVPNPTSASSLQDACTFCGIQFLSVRDDIPLSRFKRIPCLRCDRGQRGDTSCKR